MGQSVKSRRCALGAQDVRGFGVGFQGRDGKRGDGNLKKLE
jgi:hypothetical protein